MIRFGKINPTYFKGIENSPKADKPQATDNNAAPKAEKLPDVKVPLAVNIPSGYSKLGVTTLDNGQEIHNYKLSNGLRVSIVPMDTNSTTIRTVVNTGAINEDDKKRGISHFLEHMAFNGTFGADGYKKLSTGDVFRIVGNIGGATNASTNFALTDYFIQAPIFYDTDLEEIISIQGAMMNNLELPESMIEKERGPVISEINMYTDMPVMLAYNTAIKNLYNIKTTSEDYVAGTTENIKNISRDDVLNYYRSNYHPANMYTMLAGDVEPDEAIKIIAKHFHTKAENIPPRNVEKLAPIKHPIRRDLISPKATETSGYIMFNGPANNNLKDKITMDFICRILFGRSNSRLEKHFIDSSISMDMCMDKISTQPDDGQLVFFEFHSAEDEHEKALEKLYEELANFKKPSEATVNLIKKSKLSKFDRVTQAPEGILDILGRSHFETGDCSITEYKKTIESITADDIVRCANKYLDLNKASIAVVHPEKKVDSANVNFLGRRKKQVLKAENIKTYSLGNNYDVATYNTNSDYRYFSLDIKTEQMPEQKYGASSILDHMLNNGMKNVSREELDTALGSRLISNSILAGHNKIKIALHCDKSDMNDAVNVMKLQLLKPNLTEEALQTAKNYIKKRIESFEPDSVDLIFSEAITEGPNDYLAQKTMEEIDSITLDDIKELHKHILKNGVVSACFTASEEEPEYTKNILKILNSMPKAKVKTFNKDKNYEPTAEKTVVTQQNNNAQADVAIGYKFKINHNLKDEVTFTLMNNILRKMSFNDLREKQQLAYRVESMNLGGGADNELLVCNILTTTEDNDTGETSYDNIQKSINGFHKLIEDIKNGNFSDEDFNATKMEYKSELLSLGDSDRIRTNVIKEGLNSPYGVLTTNLEYSLIDTITKEDIINAANYVFQSKPIYGIRGSQAALEYNKEYFEELKA